MRRVAEINALEPGLKELTDADLRNKTEEFKMRLNAGRATLDSLLPEAFAVVREAARRYINMRHFDTQLVRISPSPISLASAQKMPCLSTILSSPSTGIKTCAPDTQGVTLAFRLKRPIRMKLLATDFQANDSTLCNMAKRGGNVVALAVF